MGCAIGRLHFGHFGELSKRTHRRTPVASGSTTITAQNVTTYLSPDNPNPKCVFVFGGSGSNKGEFIWEMLQQSVEHFFSHEWNSAVKKLQNRDEDSELKMAVPHYEYHYIDVEKLITDNLDTRIKKLSHNPQISSLVNNYVEPNPMSILDGHNSILNNGMTNHNLLHIESPDIFESRSPTKRKRSSVHDELRTQLLLYSNIITNSWILSLIKQSIEEKTSLCDKNEKLFIINLIPNRVTMFKNCLFLKQSPSFASFNFNYIAVNLVKSTNFRKDLEIRYDELFDEFNANFINYFRLLNKLLDVRFESHPQRLKFRLTKSKDAIKIRTREDIISFLMMPKRDGLEVDISQFHSERLELAKPKKSTRLTFVIANEIDLDSSTVLLFDPKEKIDIAQIRKFIQFYRLVRYSLNFLQPDSSTAI